MRNKIAQFLLFFSVLNTPAFAGDNQTHYSLLSSGLTSMEEFRAQLTELKVSRLWVLDDQSRKIFNDQLQTNKYGSLVRALQLAEASAETNLFTPRPSAICSDFGACEEVTFYDKFDKLSSAPDGNGFETLKFKNLLDDRVSQYIQQSAESVFSTRQLELGSKYYAKVFHDKKYLDPKLMQAQAEVKLSERFSSLLANGESEKAEFIHFSLNSPKSFRILPVLLKEATDANNDVAVKTLEEVIYKALLLTLDALVPVADSQNYTYPYFDGITSSERLLHVNDLYQKLVKIGQWPGVVNLTPKLRDSLQGIYNAHAKTDKVAGSPAWEVTGFYNEKENQVYLDLQSDFYENIYVYFHELWHVAWSHSSENGKQIDEILKVLNEPEGDANAQKLRKVLLTSISSNEFSAIEQQITLFHAVGFLTEDWDQAPLSSTQAWHDSYLKEESSATLVHDGDRGTSFFNRHNILAAVSIGPTIVDALPLYANHYKRKNAQIEKKLSPEFWSDQLAKHEATFEDRYFGQALGLTFTAIAPAQLFDSLTSAGIPQLSCAEAKRINNALGEYWKFGFPFEHTISDPENCHEPDPGTNHPGTEGSHGDVSGFPSLQGPQNP